MMPINEYSDFIYKQWMRSQKAENNINRNTLSTPAVPRSTEGDSGFVNSSDFTSSDWDLFVESIETIAKIERRRSMRTSGVCQKSEVNENMPMKEGNNDDPNLFSARASTPIAIEEQPDIQNPYLNLRKQVSRIKENSTLEESESQSHLTMEEPQEITLFEDMEKPRTIKILKRITLKRRVLNWLRRGKLPQGSKIDNDEDMSSLSSLSISEITTEDQNISLFCGLKRQFYSLLSSKDNKSVITSKRQNGQPSKYL